MVVFFSSMQILLHLRYVQCMESELRQAEGEFCHKFLKTIVDKLSKETFIDGNKSMKRIPRAGK